MTLSIGDKLYFVGQQNNRAKEYVTVSKIGRKWITLANPRGRDEYRIGVGDMDGKTSAWAVHLNSNYGGSVYRTEEEYKREAERERLWGEIWQAVRDTYGVPVYLTIDDLREVMRRLKIEEPKEKE